MICICEFHGPCQGTLASPDLAEINGPPLKFMIFYFTVGACPVIGGIVSEDFSKSHGVQEGSSPLTESSGMNWLDLCRPACCDCLTDRHGPLGLDFGYPEE